MKAHLTLDISDIDALVRKWAAERNIELTGFTVNSWSVEIMRVDANCLVEPVRHKINPERKTV